VGLGRIPPEFSFPFSNNFKPSYGDDKVGSREENSTTKKGRFPQKYLMEKAKTFVT
jgi:hypothetical protein